MCKLREKVLESQLNKNAEEIRKFEQKLLSLYSRLNKMKSAQAELQAELHEEARERLTKLVKARVPRSPRAPRVFTIEEALGKLGWSPFHIANALSANPGWRTKEVRI